MAYVSQELKAKLAPQIKAVLKKYGMKGTIAVNHGMTLVVNIKSGKLDMIGNYLETNAESIRMRTTPEHAESQLNYIRTSQFLDINQYWYQDHFTGDCKAFLAELIPAMKGEDFYDNSDIMTDYFDVSHYVDINVGNWQKPYELIK